MEIELDEFSSIQEDESSITNKGNILNINISKKEYTTRINSFRIFIVSILLW